MKIYKKIKYLLKTQETFKEGKHYTTENIFVNIQYFICYSVMD